MLFVNVFGFPKHIYTIPRFSLYVNIYNSIFLIILKRWIIKTTKTPDGQRTVWIPDSLVNLIQAHGYIYKGHPGSISRYLERLQDNLGIEHFSLHKLRHYYASMSHALGIPDSYIMAAGGWKSDNVLKGVYRHALKDRQKDMESKAINYLQNNLATNLATKMIFKGRPGNNPGAALFGQKGKYMLWVT